MGILFFGLFLLVSFMLFVMGAPLVYYLKHERKWMEAGCTLDAWNS